MSTFTGMLLDVSGSMESSIGDGVDEEGGTWARSIFTVIDDLIKHDLSRDNRVFAAGVGASKGESIFDTIGTIKEIQNEGSTYGSLGGSTDESLDGSTDGSPASARTIEEIFLFLEGSGARTIRKWARKSVVSTAVSEHEARLILKKLRSDREFAHTFVHDFLPASCRDWHGAVPLGGFLQGVYSSAFSTFREASVEEIREVARRSMDLIKRSFRVKAYSNELSFQVKSLNDQSVYSVQDAANVIHGCVDEKELTTQRARELLAVVEPYIYGGTPLYSALEKASGLFSRSMRSCPNHHRLLFVLSDGMAGDDGDLRHIRSQLEDSDVTIVGCYISRSSQVEPRTLHNVKGPNWEEGANFLFDLSSTIPTQLVTRAIFFKQGWQVDITNNETKLFMHVNHPQHLKEACKLARNVVCFQDSLTTVLSSVSLDIYINQENTKIKAHQQVGGTCYANASAVVLHLAMRRILGRDGGYPDFEELKDGLINRHGSDGANILRVLQQVCPAYRLHCRKLDDVSEAMEAIAAKRPVVAIFRLTNAEWEIFGSFYDNNGTGILKKEDLDISRRRLGATTSGHAVVLTSYNSECLRLMNSWGMEWADNGFFRVENAGVLGLEFIDVFWTINDLSHGEKEYYRIHGSVVADKLMRSLKGLQVAEFTCPRCQSKSKVTEFSGTLSRACCPRCHETFPSNDGEGNMLALNIYLTSLSR